MGGCGFSGTPEDGQFGQFHRNSVNYYETLDAVNGCPHRSAVGSLDWRQMARQ